MLKYRKGRLWIDGIPVEALARRFGTPLYAYSRTCLLERYHALRLAFNLREALICYALKANSNRSLCRVLAKAGAGAEVVSGGELLRALEAGFKPRGIVFSGVGKTREELALAVRKNILTINLESREEMELLMKVARSLGRRAAMSVRLNPDVDPRTHPHITTGLSENKFGVEREEALALFRRAASSPWLRVRGLQCHIGSQIREIAPYAQAARRVAGLVHDLEGMGIALELIDFGGGLGISYGGEPGLDLAAFAETLTRALAPWPRARLVVEPGRYLAADSGVLLTRVLYRKRTSSRSFLIVDAAMNDLARPSLYDAYHPVWPARLRGGRETVDVVGPVCESGDYLARGRSLPRQAAGELLALLKAGAYGFSMSSQYNSRPRAAEVLVEGRRARLIRRRETLRDLTRHEL